MFKHVLFDFDGTLADSSKGIYKSYKTACKELNLNPISINEFKPLIGPPISKIVLKLYPELSIDKANDFKEIFRLNYDNKDFKIVDWYDDVRNIIPLIASSDTCSSINIITNKPTKPTIELIQSVNLHRYFNNIYGIDYIASDQNDYKTFSNKQSAISFVLNHNKILSKKAVYVGDTYSDLLASKRNNLNFIAVQYGFHNWEEGELSQADYQIYRFEQLVRLLL